jgi:hypothetical protein
MLTNKQNINPIDRIQRIAMTGDIAEPKPLSPVENIMQHYPNVQTTEENKGGFWNGLKNFANSNGGRMLLGGLGTAGLVGLTGGKLGDALSYGVVGAGNTADNIYQKQQDQKAWEEKEAERLFRQQESDLNRQHNWDIANARIEADAQARKDAFERQKELLGLQLDNEIKKLKVADDYEMQKITDNPYLTEEQKQFQIKKLSGYDDDAYYTNLYYNGTPEEQSQAEQYFNRRTNYNNLINPWGHLKGASEIAKGAGISLDPDALNRGEVSFIEKTEKLSPEMQAYQTLIESGMSPEVALISTGLNKLGYNVTLANNEIKNAKDLEAYKTQNDAYLKNLDYSNTQAGKEADLRRSMELEHFKKSLPTEEQRDIEYQAGVLGIPASDIYNAMHDERKIKVQQALENLRKTGADIDYANARTNLANRQAENVGFEAPGFGDISQAVSDGTITPSMGNELYGNNVFQDNFMPAETKAELSSLNSINDQLTSLEQLFDKLPQSKKSAYTGGAWRDLTNTLTADETKFNAQRSLLFNRIARELGGEKGVLSDQDIKRVAEALPTIYDNPEQRAGKMSAIRDLLNLRTKQVGFGANGGFSFNNQPTTYNVDGFTIERVE